MGSLASATERFPRYLEGKPAYCLWMMPAMPVHNLMFAVCGTSVRTQRGRRPVRGSVYLGNSVKVARNARPIS